MFQKNSRTATQLVNLSLMEITGEKTFCNPITSSYLEFFEMWQEQNTYLEDLMQLKSFLINMLKVDVIKMYFLSLALFSWPRYSKPIKCNFYFKNFIFIFTSQDLSPWAYSCLLTKLNNQFVTTSSGDVWSPGLGSYFFKKFMASKPNLEATLHFSAHSHDLRLMVLRTTIA